MSNFTAASALNALFGGDVTALIFSFLPYRNLPPVDADYEAQISRTIEESTVPPQIQEFLARNQLVLHKNKKRLRQENEEFKRIFKKAREAAIHVCQNPLGTCSTCHQSICEQCESNSSLTPKSCGQHHFCRDEDDEKCPICEETICTNCITDRTEEHQQTHRSCVVYTCPDGNYHSEKTHTEKCPDCPETWCEYCSGRHEKQSPYCKECTVKIITGDLFDNTDFRNINWDWKEHMKWR